MKSFLYLKEDFIWHRQEKICGAESCGKVNHRDVPMRGMYILIQIPLEDQMDGLDIYVAGKATVNFVFDRYMSLKSNLKPTTRSNYLYMYDRFIRDTFGKRNIAEIKYSDVVQFYNHLIEKQELQINTLETVHTLLHPTFQLAVRDDIIRKNPTDGVMA